MCKQLSVKISESVSLASPAPSTSRTNPQLEANKAAAFQLLKSISAQYLRSEVSSVTISKKNSI